MIINPILKKAEVKENKSKKPRGSRRPKKETISSFAVLSRRIIENKARCMATLVADEWAGGGNLEKVLRVKLMDQPTDRPTD